MAAGRRSFHTDDKTIRLYSWAAPGPGVSVVEGIYSSFKEVLETFLRELQWDVVPVEAHSALNKTLEWFLAVKGQHWYSGGLQPLKQQWQKSHLQLWMQLYGRWMSTLVILINSVESAGFYGQTDLLVDRKYTTEKKQQWKLGHLLFAHLDHHLLLQKKNWRVTPLHVKACTVIRYAGPFTRHRYVTSWESF